MRRLAVGIAVAGVLLVAACGRTPAPAADSTEQAASGGTAAAPSEHPGKQTYDRFCVACHSSGAAGAPKLGDVAAWAPRIALGMDVLVRATMAGKPPGMPAKGNCISCSEADLRAAVEYIVEKSK